MSNPAKRVPYEPRKSFPVTEVVEAWLPNCGTQVFADIEGCGQKTLFAFEQFEHALHFSMRADPVRAKVTIEYTVPAVKRRFTRS